MVALNGCKLIQNKALAAGGGIFASYPKAFRYSCEPITTNGTLEAFTDDVLALMFSITSNKPPCDTWVANEAVNYGDVVGSYARIVRVSEANENGKITREIQENHTFARHKSGETIPTIVMRLYDEFREGPAFGTGNGTVEAMMHCSNSLFVGNVIVPFDQGEAIFTGIRGEGVPDEYNVTIDFNVTTLNSVHFTVQVRPCQIGEQMTNNRRLCANCTSSAYNFDPNSQNAECKSCPDHGDCTSQVIHPDKSYFHWWPCSVNIQPCLLQEGCAFEKRKEKLQRVTMSLESCKVDAMAIKEYMEAQCDEVVLVALFKRLIFT